MATSLLEVVGAAAGIGGIALGVFLLVERDIVRSKVLSRLPKAKAYNLLRLVIVLCFGVALAGISAWAWTETPQPTKADVDAGGNIRARDIKVESGEKGGAVSAGGDIDARDITVRQPQ